MLLDVRWLLLWHLRSWLGSGSFLLLSGLGLCLLLGTWALDSGSSVDLRAVQVGERVRSGGAELVALTSGGLVLLGLCETDDAACDLFAHASAVDGGGELGGGALDQVVIVTTLVQNDGASKNGVGSAQLNESVSGGVALLLLVKDQKLLDVTNATSVDVVVRVTNVGAVWVEDVASGVASVHQVAELVHLQGVQALRESSELASDGNIIVRLLLEVETTSGGRVAKEVELARGLNSLISSRCLSVIGGNWGDVLDEDGARAVCASALVHVAGWGHNLGS